MNMRPKKIDVQEGYDSWAEKYDTDENPMIAMVDYALSELVQDDLTGKNILEIGCGTGRNLEFLQTKGARTLTGIDVSEGMLKAARKRLGPSIDLIESDIRSGLPFPEKSFDFVLVSLVLEHIQDLTPIFSELHRVLNPKGKILLAEIHPDLRAENVSAHFKDETGQQYNLPSYLHTVDEISSKASFAGLSVTCSKSWTPNAVVAERCSKIQKRGDIPLLLTVELELRA